MSRASRLLPPALFTLGLLWGGERRAGADANKIAVVDVQHAVMATEDGIRAQTDLKKTFDKRQQELDARQTELQKTKGDIERQSQVLSREALQKRMEDWQRRMLELQQVFLDYNKELQTKQADKTSVSAALVSAATPFCRRRSNCRRIESLLCRRTQTMNGIPNFLR